MKKLMRLIVIFLIIFCIFSFFILNILDFSFISLKDSFFSSDQDIFGKEILLANDIIKSGNITSCTELREPLIKDICYLDIIIEALDPKVISKENCIFISDPYIQSFCLRLVTLRPHMRNFLLRRSSSSSDITTFSSLKCNYNNKYYNLRCIFSKVGALSHSNLSRAEQICFSLGKEDLIGECSYYIADVLFKSVSNISYTKFNSFMKFCEKVPHSSWRAECYYLLADHLAFFSLENSNWDLSRLKMISNTCTEAYNEIDYHCSNHLARLLPYNQRIKFCDFFDDFGEKTSCYRAIEVLSSDRIIKNISKNVDLCKNLTSFSEYCLLGLSRSLGSYPFTNILVGIRLCNKIPYNFRGYCFEQYIKNLKIDVKTKENIDNCNLIPLNFRNFCFRGLGRNFYHYIYRNIDPSTSICNDVPINFKKDCFDGLGRKVALSSEGNFSEALRVCDNIPLEFRKDCFFGFGKVLGWLFSGNISKGLYNFEKIPLTFQDSFFEGFGSIIGWRYKLNVSQGLEKCQRLPQKFQHYCLRDFNKS